MPNNFFNFPVVTSCGLLISVLECDLIGDGAVLGGALDVRSSLELGGYGSTLVG